MGFFDKIRKAMKKIGGVEGDTEAIKGISKAALVSCSIEHIIPEAEGSEEFTGRVADRLAERIQELLKEECGWEMTDLETLSGNEELLASISLRGNENLRSEMEELFDKQELPIQPTPEIMKEMVSAWGDEEKMGELKTRVVDSLLNDFSLTPKEEEPLIGGKELPVIAYSAINPDAAEGVRQFGGNKDAREFQEKMRATALSGITKALDVDAIVIIYARTSAEHIGNITVVNGEEGKQRADGTIKMNATIVVVTREGEIAMDAGAPGMDDLAPMKGTPLYPFEDGVRGEADLSFQPVFDDFCDLVDKCAKKAVGNITAFMD